VPRREELPATEAMPFPAVTAAELEAFLARAQENAGETILSNNDEWIQQRQVCVRPYSRKLYRERAVASVIPEGSERPIAPARLATNP